MKQANRALRRLHPPQRARMTLHIRICLRAARNNNRVGTATVFVGCSDSEAELKLEIPPNSTRAFRSFAAVTRLNRKGSPDIRQSATETSPFVTIPPGKEAASSLRLDGQDARAKHCRRPRAGYAQATNGERETGTRGSDPLIPERRQQLILPHPRSSRPAQRFGRRVPILAARTPTLARAGQPRIAVRLETGRYRPRLRRQRGRRRSPRTAPARPAGPRRSRRR